jgi:quercetin dioxygenase-like cupin family protein
MSAATHHRWEDLPNQEIAPGLHRRLITGHQLMVAHLWLEKGFVVPRHSHHNEQMTYIIEGALELALGEEGEEEVVVVSVGEVLHIPADVPHSAVALERTLDMDIFCPPRADWLDGTDDYLRR